MKKSLKLLIVTSMLILSISCGSDDNDPLVAPTINVTAGNDAVVTKRAKTSLTFAATTAEGFASATVDATGGTALIDSQPATGVEAGAVEVTFTAGSEAGAGSVIITVRDSEDQTVTATAVLTVQETEAPALTNPGQQSVQVSQSINVDIVWTAAAGFANASITDETGGTTVLVSTTPEIGTTSGTATVAFTAGDVASAGSFTFNIEDSEGETASTVVAIGISASPVPSLTGIPATASIEAGMTLGPVDATVTMADIPGTLMITKDGVDYATIDITSDGQVAQFSYTSTLNDGGKDITFVFIATDSDGDVASATHVLTVTVPDFSTKILDQNIGVNTTFSNDTIYELTGRISVVDGATLTIEAGTVIKGQPGTGTNATALLIARGSKIMAIGTANSPIIFTSTEDDIAPGQIASPNLDPSANGFWGGLIVLGNARISADNTSEQIEGIPVSDVNGLYGGSDDTDNSGTIQYVSVRHGGANIGEGNEINGITLGGVGSGTTIDHVEIVGNQDDGIEWFGGTVSVSYALVWNAGDDAIDTDQAWAGTLDNFIIVNPGDEGFELDGPEGTYAGAGHTIINGTMKAEEASGLIDLDDNTDVVISNIYFFDLTDGQNIEGYAGYAMNTNGFNASAFQVTLSGLVETTVFPDGSDAIVTEVAAGENTVGATVSEFSFTFANAFGVLADF